MNPYLATTHPCWCGLHYVSDTAYRVDYPRRHGQRPRMLVLYCVGRWYWFNEWVAFEARGRARRRAIRWWRARSRLPVPASAEDAVALAREGMIATTEAIVLRHVPGEQTLRIVGYQLGPIPEIPPPAHMEHEPQTHDISIAASGPGDPADPYDHEAIDYWNAITYPNYNEPLHWHDP